ncbi:Ldh family oxidoreductase [Streptomyces collinus]|uniref:Ldh family oxidoreductase n=1 Tax=Streptomyces collinus TaxID=42684 RepID=UPI0037A6FB74
MPHTVAAVDLLRFAAATTEAHGVPPEDARLLADTLVTAELWGHPSHGMLRLPWYLAHIRSGATAATAAPRVVSDNGAVLVVDGQDGLGQVLADRATRLGIDRAREHGISAIAVRNSGHFGTAAYFTRKAAEAGCVAMLATNASPAMAPWGGREKRPAWRRAQGLSDRAAASSMPRRFSLSTARATRTYSRSLQR